VYTHLSWNWSSWLLEHHRILRAGGLLWASFIGPTMAREFRAAAGWVPDAQGMFVFEERNRWSQGGPVVAHARRWIEEHWGRVFDIRLYIADGLGRAAGVGGAGQGWVLMRRRDVTLSAAELEAPAAHACAAT
jgi:hypothetical protein